MRALPVLLRAAATGGVALVFLGVIAWSLGHALPTPTLWDFGSFVASGRAAAEGLDPYGLYPLTFRVVMDGFEIWNPNLNPPAALPLFHLLSFLDPHEAFRIWWSLSAVSYAITVALLAHRFSNRRWVVPVLFAAALAGFWDTLVLGQIYTPLVLAGVAGWLLLDRNRPIAAGIAIGIVVAVKPNFLVWPVLLFLAGHTRAPIAAAATAAVLAVIPVALYGPEVYLQWANLVAGDGARAAFLSNASMAGILHRIGAGPFALVPGVVLLGMLAFWVLRQRPTVFQASAVGLAASIAASPLAWVHYTLFLLPVFFAGPASAPMIVAGLLLVIPVPLILELSTTPPIVQATVGSVYGWATLLVLWTSLGAIRAESPVHAGRTASSVAAE
ncbi:glycosyltransferase family 87 protein [Chthonobacter rhizosphaerae]|uniref:glycosyltransferase family 87 protein n=1 Tax=Chthonobacter rhizosphaerae TaxID=2735553 RepID=UPI0015EFA7CC|nr:glycosyltransferase family 87 protein [Chthonobacter rhizosphaerae]